MLQPPVHRGQPGEHGQEDEGQHPVQEARPGDGKVTGCSRDLSSFVAVALAVDFDLLHQAGQVEDVVEASLVKEVKDDGDGDKTG